MLHVSLASYSYIVHRSYHTMRKLTVSGIVVIVFCHLSTAVVTNVIDLEITSIIRDALVKAREEDAVMEARLVAGIDKFATDFRTTEPILFSESPLDVHDIEKKSRAIRWISNEISSRGQAFSPEEVIQHPDAVTQNITCPFVAPGNCSLTKYRSIDGSCNNLLNPLWGAGFTPFPREIPPYYERGANGVADLPRSKSRDGSPLPGARVLSTRFHHSNKSTAYQSSLTFIFSIWGQFIAHDITDRAPGKGHLQTILDCCNQDIPTAKCFNIDVPENDIFQGFGRKCLSFARSAPVTDLNCRQGQREQLNQASSFIDASSVYGQTRGKAAFLRSHSAGELAMSEPNHLPFWSHPNPQGQKQGYSTMQSGDDRVTVYPGLTGIETLWFREHNHLTRLLAEQNQQWDDETLYQEARRIVIGVIQHVTYNEWLPLVVGPEMMALYQLHLAESEYSTGYDSSIDPSTTNEVATAAFRFGHSLMRSTFNLVDKSFQPVDGPSIKLEDTFFKSSIYLMHEQQFMRGTLVDASNEMSRVVTGTLVNNLYQTRPGNGFDLPAFNIQRGRDHGLASYNDWRDLFGLSVASEFSTNSTGGFSDIPGESVSLLQEVYTDPDDVDLWTGGVSERPLPGAAIGPLFAHMLGWQFWKYRFGDRFWYETDSTPQAFTLDQLSQIRNVTLAQILCRTLDLDTIQPRVFEKYTAPGNGRIPCSQFMDIDISKWRA